MALELDISYNTADFNTNTIYINDITGLYSATNLGGYGRDSGDANSHKDSSDVGGDPISTWRIIVTRPDATNLVISPSVINTAQYDVIQEIVQLALIDSQDIINGTWTFVLEADGTLGPTTYTSNTLTQYIYNIGTIESQIFAKFATEVDFCEYPKCACNKELMTLWTYYMALKAAIEEQNTAQADYLVTVITTLLS